MDLLDLVMVMVVILAGVHGYRTGLIRQVVRLFGTVIAYAAALWLRPVVAPWLEHANLIPSLPAPVHLLVGDPAGALSFVLVFAVAFALLRFAAGLVEMLFSLPLLSTANRIAGMAVSLVLAVVVLYVVVIAGHLIPNERFQRQLAHSVIANWLMHAPPPDLQPGSWVPQAGLPQITSPHS
jgi:uncharacterized membrane protein required for colicin V production